VIDPLLHSCTVLSICQREKQPAGCPVFICLSFRTPWRLRGRKEGRKDSFSQGSNTEQDDYSCSPFSPTSSLSVYRPSTHSSSLPSLLVLFILVSPTACPSKEKTDVLPSFLPSFLFVEVRRSGGSWQRCRWKRREAPALSQVEKEREEGDTLHMLQPSLSEGPALPFIPPAGEQNACSWRIDRSTNVEEISSQTYRKGKKQQKKGCLTTFNLSASWGSDQRTDRAINQSMTWPSFL